MNGPMFDASSEPPGRLPSDAGSGQASFLGIRFRCCRAYGRLYRNASGTRYEGRCPKCGGRLSVPIGLGGTSRRFFTAE